MLTVTSRPRRRAGFTLIELMVVIAIIVILVALLVTGVWYAIARSKSVGTSSEISQVANSVGAFKAKYGVYPPSRIRLCSNYALYTTKPTPAANGGPQLDSDSIQFINRMWPNIGNFTNINWAGNGSAVDEILEGDQCLVFFLGGIPNPAGTSPQIFNDFSGFSVNPQDPCPFSAANQNVGRVGPFFTFSNDRLYLRNGTNFPSFKDYHNLGNAAQPYLYFSAYNRKNGYAPSYAMPVLGVSPYYSTVGNYFNPDSFQIISAGGNGLFGPGGQWTPATAEGVYKAGSPGADDQANFYQPLLGVSQ
jgi:general secretion pathway protein G